MDFITNLLQTLAGFNTIMTCVDHLSKLVILIPCTMSSSALSAEEVAQLFFTHVVHRFGLPGEVVHDHDSRFTADFGAVYGRCLGHIFTFLLHTICKPMARLKGCTGQLSLCSVLS